MTKFYFGKHGKLVRDKIPAMSEAEGHIVKVRQLSRKDLADAILGKFLEEINELKEAFDSGDEKAEKKEIADVQTLLDSYIKVRNFSMVECEAVKEAKKDERGAFDCGYWIDWIDLNDDSADGQSLLKKYRREFTVYIEDKKKDDCDEN
jgi:predicted house-cleaning noncanonical NTP pyrophosphatase (MazG superfamily)